MFHSVSPEHGKCPRPLCTTSPGLQTTSHTSHGVGLLHGDRCSDASGPHGVRVMGPVTSVRSYRFQTPNGEVSEEFIPCNKEAESWVSQPYCGCSRTRLRLHPCSAILNKGSHSAWDTSGALCLHFKQEKKGKEKTAKSLCQLSLSVLIRKAGTFLGASSNLRWKVFIPTSLPRTIHMTLEDSYEFFDGHTAILNQM